MSAEFITNQDRLLSDVVNCYRWESAWHDSIGETSSESASSQIGFGFVVNVPKNKNHLKNQNGGDFKWIRPIPF